MTQPSQIKAIESKTMAVAIVVFQVISPLLVGLSVA